MKKLVIALGLILAVAVSGLSAQEKKPEKQGVKKEKGEKKEKKQEITPELKKKIESSIKKLGDEKLKIRDGATKELEKMILNSKEWKDIISQLKKALKETKDPEIKCRLEKLLYPYVEWGLTPSLLKKFPDIVERLESPDARVRRNIASKLGMAKNKNATTALCKLLKDRDESVRCYTANALGGIKDEKAVKHLIEALKDKYSGVRLNAANALGEIGNKQAVKPLIKALEDKDVRVSAARALGMIGDKSALPHLKKMWRQEKNKQEKDIYTQVWIAFALVKMGDENAFKFLIETLYGNGPDGSFYVVVALGKLKSKAAVKHLIKVLKSRMPGSPCLGTRGLQATAAWALGEIGDRSATRPLIEMLKDEDRDVRSTAAAALKKITGKDFGEDYEKWLKWYEKAQK